MRRAASIALLLAAACPAGQSAKPEPGTKAEPGAKADNREDANVTTPSMKRQTTPCRAALSAFAAKRFADAPPLPAGCALADVADLLVPQAASDGTGLIGRDYRKLEYRSVAVAGYPDLVRAWHDGGKVLLVDAANPGISDSDWRKLRDALGPPDARADFRFDVLDVKAGHWIWAARGLALFLSLGDDGVVRVVQFPPTTAARYLDELELHLGSRERPLD
jgi:hypothetical protein